MSGRSLLSCFTGPVPGADGALLGAVDLNYALEVARRVAGFGTYERGFRPAGTDAVRRCAEYLAGELRRLGLPQVDVMEYPLDGWEFAGARVEAEGGPTFDAVAYGGACGTGPEGFAGELVDCGDGTAADLSRVDVRGKIALVEMDLEALNWPGTALLEAAHHGAAGVICWPSNHYALTPGALHTHDLQVECPVPMLNVSRDDGRALRSFQRARIFSTARILKGATGRNIVALLPGTETPDEVVIIGDHYDAWFDGFMDDAVGVGAVLALAQAAVKSGYKPRRTLAFVLHDAEEFGQADSPWDWCTGAYAQVNRLTPDWVGRAVGAVIFELCGFKEAPTFDWYVSPELAPLAEDVLDRLKTDGHYPLGKQLFRLVRTWEDSFSYTVAGIPTAANLEIPEYVRSHYYHTQFDTEALLDMDKYALHVAALGLLALRLDQEIVPPYDFAARAQDLRRALPENAPGRLFDLVDELERVGERMNFRRSSLSHGRLLIKAAGVINRGLTWVGGDGLDDTLYPHEQPYRDYQALKAHDLGSVTGINWGQNVSYPVYRHQLFRHIAEPDRCWQWAGGRVSPYVDVWHAFVEGRPLAPNAVREARERLDAAYEHEMRVLTEALAVLRQVI
ncbi:MAG TPA: M28 family peptidase [Symbiobacteriaceae bacterium]|nr:M28 family peptidase [Symbiobacteriaceae bacterium]